VRTVIGLNHVENIVCMIGDEFSRSVGQGNRILLQLLTELGHSEDPTCQLRLSSAQRSLPEGVARDTNQSLWTHASRQCRREFQRVVNEGNGLQHILICVQQPRSTRESHDGWGAVNICPNQLGGLSTEETEPSIG
jgi:hypothetical protein